MVVCILLRVLDQVHEFPSNAIVSIVVYFIQIIRYIYMYIYIYMVVRPKHLEYHCKGIFETLYFHRFFGGERPYCHLQGWATV
jgi:hypothetical protein